jgi:hypothetical protein
MFGPWRPQKTYTYYKQTAPTGSDINRASSSTFGVVSCLRRDLARPRTTTRAEGSLPRKRTPAPRLGHHSQGLRKGPGPSRHLDRPLRSLSQLSPEDTSPTHELGSVTPGLVPLADDLAKLQLPLLHLLGQGGHVLPGRRSFFSSRLLVCPR